MTKPRFKKVYIEIGNRCNLHCHFCPQSTLRRQAAQMSVEQFREIVQELAPHTRQFCLHLMGEPLLHEDILALLDVVAAEQGRVALTTNGSMMAERHQRAMLHPAVQQLNISLQSFAGSFGDADDGVYLGRILALCSRALSESPALNINLRLWNAASPGEVLQRNRSLLERLYAHFDLVLPNELSRLGNRLAGRVFVNVQEAFSWPDMPDTPDHAPDSAHKSEPINGQANKRGRCRGGQDMLGVLADGTVVPCCLDSEGELALGQAREGVLKAIASARNHNLVEGFKRGELREALCQRCDYIQRFAR